MTDLTNTIGAAPTPSGIGHPASDVARLKKRYRSETRFQMYGVFALTLTSLFLAVLLFDIVRNGWPALWQHSLRLEIDTREEFIALGGKRDVETLNGADYFPAIREALKSAVPSVEGRTAERTLQRLLSTGASDSIRKRLVAEPGLVGSKVTVPLLLSATSDLYFKGVGTAIQRQPGRGTLTPIAADGAVLLLSSSNDFADDLARIKAALTKRSQALAAEATRLERIDAKGQADRIKELRAEVSALKARYEQPNVPELLDSNMPTLLVAIHDGLLKITELSDSQARGEVIFRPKVMDEAAPASWHVVTFATPESSRKVTDLEVALLDALNTSGKVEKHFAWRFFTAGDSREPELAGILGAIVGTALTLLVTLTLTLPIGVLAAIYLEEFAPKNRLTDLIEVNINNLAAVPSIVFGLLGLAVFINFFGLPRSAPLVGGLVLALLVLPTIIIAARAAIKAVPPSIKEAALGVGASHQQAVFHHILPVAMPGIMTGSIIGMAHALGETAPLLMIGMVAFIVDIPSAFTEAATALPVQIFLWSDLPEQGFKAKTAAAIMVLLGFLLLMNGAAIWLRNKFERRW